MSQANALQMLHCNTVYVCMMYRITEEPRHVIIIRSKCVGSMESNECVNNDNNHYKNYNRTYCTCIYYLGSQGSLLQNT